MTRVEFQSEGSEKVDEMVVAYHILAMLFLVTLTACEVFERGGDDNGSSPPSESAPPDEEDEEEEPPHVYSDHIVVISTADDKVTLIDPNGTVVKVLFTGGGNVGQVSGVAWNGPTSEILVSLDSPDHVRAIDPITNVNRVFILSASLNGQIRGLTTLPDSKDVLVIESNLLERFLQDGTRVAIAPWPLGTFTVPQMLSPLSSGGFLVCTSGNLDKVEKRDENGTVLFTSAITGDLWGCAETPNEDVAVVRKTPPEVHLYTSDLITRHWAYSDPAILTTPRGLAVRKNGNILGTDISFDHIFELAPDGTFVRKFGDATIYKDPTHMIVIP